MTDRLRLHRAISARILAAAPPGALAAYRLAHRLRGRGSAHAPPAAQRGSQRISASDTEGRFLAEAGAVPVPELLVPAPMISAARNAASQAAAELGTTEPEVRWFRNVKGGQPARGWFCSFLSGSVWISASLSVDKVYSVVAHECKHRHDHLRGYPMTEKAARAFSARYEQPSDGRAFAPRPAEFVSYCDMRS